MFSGRKSRSHSASSRPEEPQAPQQNAYDQAQSNHPPLDDFDIESSIGDVDTDEYRFTQGHLLGAILLKLAHDNTALARKCHMREMETNIHDLCSDFQTSIQLEEDARKATAIKANMEENERQLQRELNSHVLHQEIEPPSYFSPTPTWTSPHKMADSLKIFPSRNKFTGSHRDNNMTIVEFLSLVNTAQQQCQLSESEFKDALKQCTTGRAHILLLEWIATGQDMSSIYHNFTLHFDKRLTSDEARIQINAYRAPRNSSFAEVLSHIMMLASRICTNMPDEASRKATYNMEVINALIRCLPATSSTMVRNTNSQLSARLGRSCEATELSRALNTYRSAIDTDIKTHGGEMNRGRTTKPDSREAKKRNPAWGQYSSYNLSSTISKTFHPRGNNTTRLPPIRARPARAFQTSQRPATLRLSRPSGPYNRFPRSSSSNFRSNGRRPPQRPRHNALTGCSLCGQPDHKASEGCDNMRTDDGKKYKTLPSYVTCSLCPGARKNTLGHPPQYCPFRQGGPLEHLG